MKTLAVAASGMFLGGCAALESGVRGGTDLLFGSPQGQQIIDTATGAASALPPPWNIIVTGVVSMVGGVGLWNYRRRLLKADPTKVD